MSSSTAEAGKKSVPLAPVLVALIAGIALVLSFVYVSKPVTKAAESPASQEAKAYLQNLALSDVSLQATENLLNQRVVEVLGKISNNGPRELKSIDVYCLFYGVDGHELHRERLRIVGAVEAPGALKPGETKAFRLPFDSLPEGWNQAIPKIVIAQITFVS